MMLQTGGCHCFPFLFLLFSLHLSPILAYWYFMKDCSILYSDNVSAGVSVECGHGHGPGILLVSLVPDDIPRDVISLDLNGNVIQKIHRTDFYHLTNLRDLDLSYNPITHVDDGAFVPLVQLKVLYMNANKLTTLTDNMFQGLSNLLILRLDGNNITSINPAAFQSLTSLQELSLMSNKIIDIITILKLPSLQVLNISTDELVSFQSKDLPLNMSSELRELRIISGSIKMFSITTAVFPHLKTTDLSDCCSYSGWEWDIPDKYFLRNITTLYLSSGGYGEIRNIIQALQNLDSLVNLGLRFRFKDPGWTDRDLLNIVCKIPTLRTLRLQGNIDDSIIETLSPCTQLTSLDLSWIGLTELSNGSIKHMNQLSHLNLANNRLSKVPTDVMNLSMLQILDLSYNRIENLSCSDFLNLTRITHLHLDKNNIAELQPCVFQHLKELKVLTLNGMNGNGFIMMSKGEFMSLKSLKQLEFSYARACDLWNSNSLEGLDELETLSLDFMYSFKMTSSPPHVLLWQHNNTTLLPNLKSLTVIFKLTYIVDPFDIPFLWDMLSDMKNLEHIYVVATPWSNVYRKQPDPDSFKHVPQLKTLSLINFNLTSLDFLTQAYLPRLSWLDLSQNELTVIDVFVFSFLPALKYINMNNNPFNCSDCSNADFQQWMQNKQTLVVDAHLYTCAYPLAKKGTRFLDIDYHSCFVDNSFTYFISSTCVIVLTLLTSFTCHFLSLHLLYAYYLFLTFFYDAKLRKRGSPERYDAFISYNVHDELWVCREMLPVLEGEQGWRLCLHHRDFLPGKPIIENIADAIYGSRKTICVISHHYLESEWCSREFQMASYRLFDEQKDVLILVFLEDIPAHKLSPRLRRLMKSHTYLSWSQAGQHPGLFWQNLRRALDTPHTDLDLNQ